MELNAKNCLGPSAESIPMTYELQKCWFDEHVQVIPPLVPGYDTEHTVYEASDDEVAWVERRMGQLEDLMSLRDPIHPFMEFCGGYPGLCNGNQADFDAYTAYCNGEVE